MTPYTSHPSVVAVVVDHTCSDADRARRAAASLIRTSPHKTPEQVVSGLLERLQKVRLRWRRRLAEQFFRAEWATAVARAAAMLGNRPDGEDIASATFLELLEGRTTREHFYHALKANVLDWIRMNGRACQKTVPIVDFITPSLEPSSHRLEDQDPLDILIARDEQEQKLNQIEKAKQIAQRDWRYCWVGQKKWGQELGISTARSGKP